MQLEDHAGDVVAKARQQAGLSWERVAAVAGVDVETWRRFEAEGHAPEGVNWPAVADLLALNAAKLDGLIKGWTPPRIGLDRWRELRLLVTRGAGYTVNAYLVWDEVTREAALFDTGFEATPALELIKAEQLQLKHIFLTHSHYDHVQGLEAVRRAHPKARLHSSSPEVALHERNRPTDFIHLGSLRITNRPTPGHTPEGTTYVVGNWPEDAPPVAFVGDALFAGSMGRVSGAAEQARQAIRQQILSLPPETLICPGHGPLTTVAEELAHNPFF